MLIDQHIWLLILFNVTFILAFSWVSYKFIKGYSTYDMVSAANHAIFQLCCSGWTVIVNRYLIFRRRIKLDTDDDPPHHLLSLNVVRNRLLKIPTAEEMLKSVS